MQEEGHLPTHGKTGVPERACTKKGPPRALMKPQDFRDPAKPHDAHQNPSVLVRELRGPTLVTPPARPHQLRRCSRACLQGMARSSPLGRVPERSVTAPRHALQARVLGLFLASVGRRGSPARVGSTGWLRSIWLHVPLWLQGRGTRVSSPGDGRSLPAPSCGNPASTTYSQNLIPCASGELTPVVHRHGLPAHVRLPRVDPLSRPPPVSFSPPNAPPISAPLVPRFTLAMPQSEPAAERKRSEARTSLREDRGREALRGRRSARRSPRRGSRPRRRRGWARRSPRARWRGASARARSRASRRSRGARAARRRRGPRRPARCAAASAVIIASDGARVDERPHQRAFLQRVADRHASRRRRRGGA